MSNLDLSMNSSSNYSLFKKLPGIGGFLGNLFTYNTAEKGFFKKIKRKIILFLIILTLIFIIPFSVSENSDKDYSSVLWPSLGIFTSFWSLGLITLNPKGIL